MMPALLGGVDDRLRDPGLVEPKPLPFRARSAMPCASGATPAVPWALPATAAAIPATCVPW